MTNTDRLYLSFVLSLPSVGTHCVHVLPRQLPHLVRHSTNITYFNAFLSCIHLSLSSYSVHYKYYNYLSTFHNYS